MTIGKRRALPAAAWALSLVLVLSLAPHTTPAQNVVIDPGAHYNTEAMISRTIEALPQCLKYCVIGVEIRLRVTPFSVEVFFVPRVEHHMAALHVMASDRFPEEAYIEWSHTFGVVQKWLLDELAYALGSALGGPPIAESSGGRTRYGKYGEHQATNFKEIEIMGHPVAVLPKLVDSTGQLSADAVGGGSSGVHDAGTGQLGQVLGSFIPQWLQWAMNCFRDPRSCAMGPVFPGDALSQLFSMAEAINQIISALEAIKGVLDFVEMADIIWEIAEDVGNEGWGAGGGVQIDRLLCPNDIRYFYPYYLSGPDALFWRSGWPITDYEYTRLLLNPFSGDRVGRSGELWGHIYPRHGFLNNDHPGRTAPTLSYRAAHLLADSGVQMRPKLITGDANGDWQSISPQPTQYCEANIADLPTPIDPEGGYAYNIWPKYTCPLSEIGVLVAFIPFRFCF